VDDLDERPAVADRDTGADERYGYLAAGGLLVFVGWGILIAANLLLHRLAPSGGIALGPWRVFPAFGPFAWAAAALGAASGLFGLVLVQYGRHSPAGRFVLPGQPY
jgi:hypothetical protein